MLSTFGEACFDVIAHRALKGALFVAGFIGINAPDKHFAEAFWARSYNNNLMSGQAWRLLVMHSILLRIKFRRRFSELRLSPSPVRSWDQSFVSEMPVPETQKVYQWPAYAQRQLFFCIGSRYRTFSSSFGLSF
jgi:hypothetical protein